MKDSLLECSESTTINLLTPRKPNAWPKSSSKLVGAFDFLGRSDSEL